MCVVSCFLIYAETTVEAVAVSGKCEVVCGENLEEDKDEWFSAKPDRYYFYEVRLSHTMTRTVWIISGWIALCLRHTTALHGSLRTRHTVPEAPPTKERYVGWCHHSCA